MPIACAPSATAAASNPRRVRVLDWKNTNATVRPANRREGPEDSNLSASSQTSSTSSMSSVLALSRCLRRSTFARWPLFRRARANVAAGSTGKKVNTAPHSSVNNNLTDNEDYVNAASRCQRAASTLARGKATRLKGLAALGPTQRVRERQLCRSPEQGADGPDIARSIEACARIGLSKTSVDASRVKTVDCEGARRDQCP